MFADLKRHLSPLVILPLGAPLKVLQLTVIETVN